MLKILWGVLYICVCAFLIAIFFAFGGDTHKWIKGLFNKDDKRPDSSVTFHPPKA